MHLQARFTNSVIEGALRFPQTAGVYTHDQIRTELVRQLDAGEITGTEVAKLLGTAAARVTEMKKGGRRIQQDEMPKLAARLGLLGDTIEMPTEEQLRAMIAIAMDEPVQGLADLPRVVASSLHDQLKQLQAHGADSSVSEMRHSRKPLGKDAQPRTATKQSERGGRRSA